MTKRLLVIGNSYVSTESVMVFVISSKMSNKISKLAHIV